MKTSKLFMVTAPPHEHGTPNPCPQFREAFAMPGVGVPRA